MQEPIKPDFEAFSGLDASWSSRWPRAIANIYGCELAIIAIVAIAWIGRPLSYVSLAMMLGSIIILGISGALIRNRNVQTETENEQSSLEPGYGGECQRTP